MSSTRGRRISYHDTALHTSPCSSLAEAFICVGHHERQPDPGYLALRHALRDAGVATRNMGAELSLNAWDAMAGLLLVEEAGGFAAPFPGPRGPQVPAPALGCASGIAAPLMKLVAAW